MRLTRLICLASALLCLPMCAAPAVAQTGQYQAPRTLTVGERNDILLDANGAQIVSSGVTNGGAPTAGPTLVAGSDGANVRTIRTNSIGAVFVGGPSLAEPAGLSAASGVLDAGGATRPLAALPMVSNGAGSLTYQRTASSADATTGTGLLGAGILGQYQTALPTYANGQFGTLAMTNRGELHTAIKAMATPGGDGVSNAALASVLPIGSGVTGAITPLSVADYMYDPASTGWVRLRGDSTGGLYTQERERSQFFAEAVGILAANATYTGTTRDGGASPSQWGTFSCFARSDQAGAMNLSGSTDNVVWTAKISVALVANTPVRVTDRNDTRYSRCSIINGATANTTAPVLNSSFGQ